MNIDYDSALNSLIKEPLSVGIGEELTGVKYVILALDQDTFQLNSPNSSGLCGIILQFGRVELHLYPGRDRRLRATGKYFNIEARVRDASDTATWDAELTTVMNAETSELWSHLISQTASSVDVVASDLTPQVIVIRFGFSEVSIATGYSGEPIIVGDGDEILINPWGNLEGQPTTLGNNWNIIAELRQT